jgi:tRNA pseudouridine38-40 synthase
MGERRIKLVLAYDGTDFRGWQRQDGQRTVQGVLEEALERIHGHPVAAAGAGRTDSGVHARGQVASFGSDIASIPERKYAAALNALLPPDLRVLSSAEAQAGFNARFDARARTYRYYILPRGQALPTDRLYAWTIEGRPDMGALNRMAACLRGEIDFSAFCVPRDASLSRRRYIYHAVFFQEGRFIVFEIKANAFLWRMVRSLVGSLVEWDRQGLPSDTLAQAIASRDRRRAGPTAPARGLFLWEVEYGPDSQVASPDDPDE